MSNRIKLILISGTPLLVGNLLNFIYMNVHDFPFMLANFIFCVYWFIIGRQSVKYSEAVIKSTLLANGIGIISILVILLSYVFTGGYYTGFLGIQAQMYFMPLVSVVSNLLSIIGTVTSNAILIGSFFMLNFLYLIGYKTASTRH